MEEEIYALQRSELLDNCTCNICLSIDGRVFDPGDPITKIDKFCAKCRGIWVAILKDEVDPPKITGLPENLREVITNQQITPLDYPIVNPKSLAFDFLNKKKKPYNPSL